MAVVADALLSRVEWSGGLMVVSEPRNWQRISDASRRMSSLLALVVRAIFVRFLSLVRPLATTMIYPPLIFASMYVTWMILPRYGFSPMRNGLCFRMSALYRETRELEV